MSGRTMYEKVQIATTFLRKLTSVKPTIGLILGSGLNNFSEEIEEIIRVRFQDIPFFTKTSVEGHAGELIIGTVNECTVVILNGRFHMYEGHEPQATALPIYVLKQLGVKCMIVTNAAGGVNPSFKIGDLMLISDHINLTGRNPLVGPNDSRLGERFPDMSNAYDRHLRKIVMSLHHTYGLTIHEGIYAGMLGPSYETPAEIKMIRTIGGDAVGMSTVTEVIAAKHAGLNVLGLSCISNMASDLSITPLSHEEVIEATNKVKIGFTSLLKDIIREMNS